MNERVQTVGMHVIRNNLIFSVAYNLLDGTLALLGLLDPLIAAVLMPISSVTIVLAPWRSRTFDVPVVEARRRVDARDSNVPTWVV